MKEVDVVIISNSKDRMLRQLTEDCIESLLASESNIRFQVVVIESVPAINFDRPSVSTIYPKTPFGYHAYLNLGRKMGKAPYVCLCNNDLLFEKEWASHLLEVMEDQPDILSASPYCRNSHPGRGIKDDGRVIDGYRVGHHITGWCIFQQRKIYNLIGDLDESFVFWYADNDYSETIKHHHIRHVLVTKSHVNHLISKTIRKTTSPNKSKLTHGQKRVFERKWIKNNHPQSTHYAK